MFKKIQPYPYHLMYPRKIQIEILNNQLSNIKIILELIIKYLVIIKNEILICFTYFYYFLH